jgi:3-hydroxyacyl-CoA dehydrogenase
MTNENGRTRPGRVGLLGAGTIGSGWAALYLAQGWDVDIHDPGPQAEARARGYLDEIWPLVSRALPNAFDEVPQGHLRFVDEAEAVNGVDVAHESAPESVELKRAVYARIEAHADPELLVLSSSGGLMPSVLQAEMDHPSRLVVAHPLSPVYALPLVELLGGRATSAEAVDRAADHLTSLGKHVVRLRREVPGYLTNRLTFALLREAVHCLAEDVAGAQEIEDAVVHGVTPRWVMGGALTSLALAGGPAGMRGVMANFADAIDGWWADLGAPTLDPSTRELLVRSADSLVGDRGFADLVAERDAATVAFVERFHPRAAADLTDR